MMIIEKYCWKGLWVHFFINKSPLTLLRILWKYELLFILKLLKWKRMTIHKYFWKGLWVHFLINKSSLTLLIFFWNINENNFKI